MVTIFYMATITAISRQVFSLNYAESNQPYSAIVLSLIYTILILHITTQHLPFMQKSYMQGECNDCSQVCWLFICSCELYAHFICHTDPCLRASLSHILAAQYRNPSPSLRATWQSFHKGVHARASKLGRSKQDLIPRLSIPSKHEWQLMNQNAWRVFSTACVPALISRS